jgi:peptidylprolyl isomerase
MRRIVPLFALPVSVLALAAAGCGSSTHPANIPSGGSSTSSADTTPAAPTPTPTTPAPTVTPAGAATSKTTDLSKKPVIPKQPKTAPTKLVVQDIVKGTGATATDGKNLTVRYVGVLSSNGKQFDASWDRKPNSFDFALGQGSVIPGWDQGLVGMKVGGRRQLTIPSDLAYGPQGQPPTIPPNAPLVFVVDLKKVS